MWQCDGGSQHVCDCVLRVFVKLYAIYDVCLWICCTVRVPVFNICVHKHCQTQYVGAQHRTSHASSWAILVSFRIVRHLFVPIEFVGVCI